MRVLTGPIAAAQHGLDGFRECAWPEMLCSPASQHPKSGVLRTRRWHDPMVVGDLTLAHPILILRHLANGLEECGEQPDGLSIRDRVEMAVEHALRLRLVTVADLQIRSSRSIGDRTLHEVMQLRGDDPPTESYAETRAVQILRSWEIKCFRQLWIYERGRPKHRVDLVIPFDQKAKRPEVLTVDVGLLLEVDSREFHDGRFEQDHARQTTYDLLGFAWTSFTPTQLERQRNRERLALQGTLDRARRSVRSKKPRTQLGKASTQLRKSA
jgi:hypothetical protein